MAFFRMQLFLLSAFGLYDAFPLSLYMPFFISFSFLN